MAVMLGTREDELIARYIDPNGHGRGPAEARLWEYGTSVWALIAYLDACGGDQAQVAADHELPPEAVQAALAYYGRHKRPIDARILLNAAA